PQGVTTAAGRVRAARPRRGRARREENFSGARLGIIARRFGRSYFAPSFNLASRLHAFSSERTDQARSGGCGGE
ncbi:MAG TPA: hypothetical protein VF488_06600, partial [Gemmatimonadaceae bacterium]